MKDLRKRVLSLLLAACMVLTLMPAMAFAEDAAPIATDAKAAVDAIVDQGIIDANEALAGGDYAELTRATGTDTITISIKDATVEIATVKKDIIDVLVGALIAETSQSAIAKIADKNGSNSITLSELTADNREDKIVAFAKSLIEGVDGLGLETKIGELAGQKCEVKVTPVGEGAQDITYTIEFVPDIDAVIEDGIVAAGEDVKAYATISDLVKETGKEAEQGGTVTITLNAGASGITLTEVQDDIIKTLLKAINDNKAMLKKIDNGDSEGSIDFSAGDVTVDEAATGKFVLGLGLKGDQSNGNVGTNTLLGVLPGQECKVTVTGKGADSADITATYTIKFDLDFDSIITEGIDAVNTAIAEEGSYATLKPLTAQTVTVSISNGNKRVGDVYDDVITPLVEKLADYSDLVKEIRQDGNPSNSITLAEVKGDPTQDKGLIVNFVVDLKLLGSDVTVQQLADATLDQLYGKEFTVLLTSAGMGEKAPYKSYTVKFEEKQPDPVVPGTGYIQPTTPTKQTPTVTGDSSQVDWKLSEDGSSLTITPKDGYEITDVTVNGVSKGAVNSLSGLKTGDQVVITSRKILTEEEKAEIERLRTGVENTKIILRSKAAKKGIRLDWTKAKGFKVDYYEVFKSLKRYSGFGKAAYYKTTTGTKTYYINTKELERGTRYYYKVRGVRSFADGTTAYTQWSTKAWRKSRVTR